MIPPEQLPHKLEVESTGLDHDLAELQPFSPEPSGTTIAWLGSKGRSRWLLLSWFDCPPRLTVGIWSEDQYGARFPVRHGTVSLKVWEIPRLARAVLCALARARGVTTRRHAEQAEFAAERAAGGAR